jgi:hypothetical protein
MSKTQLVSHSYMFSIYFLDEFNEIPNIYGSLDIYNLGETCSCQDDPIFDAVQGKIPYMELQTSCRSFTESIIFKTGTQTMQEFIPIELFLCCGII